MFPIHTKTQPKAVLKFPRFEERFEKLRFRDGLVWTVGLTVGKKKKKRRFQFLRRNGEEASVF